MLRRRAMLVGLIALDVLVLVGGLVLLVNRPHGGEASDAPVAAVRGETSSEITPTAESNAALSVALSKAAYPEGPVQSVVLARDDVWVDALSSSTLQGELGAPLLLTSRESLAPVVRAELERLGARTVYLMGGPKAFAPEITRELSDQGYTVERIPGDTAVANAVAVAGQYLPDAKTALLVRGVDGNGTDETRGYVDALAAGAWAASEGMPVLLTDPFKLSPETAGYLAQSRVEKVIIAGGRIALGGSVIAELERLGIEVERIGGEDRFETAARIAELRGADPKNPSVLLIDGSGQRMWVAGFAAAVYSMRAAAPILLTDNDLLPAPTNKMLEALPARLVCGPGVTEDACAAAKELAEPAR
jgi:putative cell wall-binding protein